MIEYLLWAPDRATFLATMQALALPNGMPVIQMIEGKLAPASGVRMDEIGPVVETPATYDDEGDELTPAVVIPGHHVNMAAVGWLASMLTEDMPAEGSVFQRTRILDLLGEMNWSASQVGEPEGYVGSSGIKIFDPALVASRMRVWA